MAGTHIGGLKAAETNKERYGENHYKIIGRAGGEVAGIEKGFAKNPGLAVEAGRKGGQTSGRGRAKMRASKLYDSTEI